MTIRPASTGDLPFLARMLVEAAHPPWTDPKPTAADALADPRAGLYLRDWGRPGDLAVLAEDADGRPLGAAWCRRFSSADPGWGFVSEDVPELAIGVVPEARGQGIGSALLAGLVETAIAAGERALSLSVSAQNPMAERLYRGAGFVRTGGTDRNPTMLLALSGPDTGAREEPSWPEWQRAYRDGVVLVVPPAAIAARGDELRRRFDPVSAAIAGAHVSLAPPFARSPSARDLAVLADLLVRTPALTVSLGPAAQFAGSAVVYLPIEPQDRLDVLRAELMTTGLFRSDRTSAFPYVPHLTISEFGDDPAGALEAARALAIPDRSFTIRELTWIVPDDEFHLTAWRTFPLATVPVRTRAALPGDAAAIATIYNEGIEDRVATLETTPRTAEERAAWLKARSPRHPVLVAEEQGGGVVGWGSLNPFNPRSAYDHVADISVYVARSGRGQGLGGLLLSALEERARELGYHKLVLAALARNERGARLYGRQGFRLVGTYIEQGTLDGVRVDVVVMEKLLRRV